jgi:8-oxo-dGTP pyrophosphatase MutT (NUDIX family)
MRAHHPNLLRGVDVSRAGTQGSVERLRRVLTTRLAQKLDAAPPLLAAGVLVPIFTQDDRPHLLFTRRTETVLTHKGQISFPGGQHEVGDGSLLETALREASEEIGLHPGRVDVVGELDDAFSAVSRFVVSPYVGLVSGSPEDLRPAPTEVKSLLVVPIDVLLDPAVHRSDTRTWMGEPHVIHYYTVGDDVIWGLTGWILHQFLGLWSSGG